jgi:CRP/FNR family transcriptional regulator
MAFLQRLSAESLDRLHEHGVKREWPRRQCIFRAGEPCSGIHLVLNGLVKLYRSNAAGHEQIVLLEGKGSVLGVTPVVDRGEQLATAATLKATTTLFVSNEVFLGLYQEREDVREAVAAEMARRLRLAVGLLETIALKSINARVATRILELATTHDALDGSRHFNLLLPQDELAHVLGTSRESVARALAELRANGVVEQRGPQIRVVDAGALFECANVKSAEPSTPLPDVI